MIRINAPAAELRPIANFAPLLRLREFYIETHPLVELLKGANSNPKSQKLQILFISHF